MIFYKGFSKELKSALEVDRYFSINKIERVSRDRYELNRITHFYIYITINNEIYKVNYEQDQKLRDEDFVKLFKEMK